MDRNEFALGVLVGGLAGAALGYLIRRDRSDAKDELDTEDTIDLTPALRRRAAVAIPVGEVAEASE